MTCRSTGASGCAFKCLDDTSRMDRRFLFALALVAGCGADRLTSPEATICANTEMEPGPAFRIVYGARPDTTPRTLNRYLEPHRSADTVFIGGGVSAIFSNAAIGAGYCVTVFDSLSDHLPNAQSYVVVP